MAMNDTRDAADATSWFDLIADLESRAWWAGATVERLGGANGRGRWRVSDTSDSQYGSLLAALGSNLIGKAIIFTVRIERQREPASAACGVRLLLTHKTSGRESVWAAALDPHTGQNRVQSNAYGAFAEVDEQVDSFEVTVVAMAPDDDIVDARAQIIPAVGTTLDDQGPHATGSIVVRDVSYRIVSMAEGQRLTLQFRRNQIRRERREQGSESSQD